MEKKWILGFFLFLIFLNSQVLILWVFGEMIHLIVRPPCSSSGSSIFIVSRAFLYTYIQWKDNFFFSCFIHVAPFIQQPCHLTLVCKEKYDQIRTVYVFGKYTSNLSWEGDTWHRSKVIQKFLHVSSVTYSK